MTSGATYDNVLRYISERPEKRICLAHTALTIQAVDPERGCWENIDKQIVTTVKQLNIMDEKAMLLRTLTVTEEIQGFRVTFWCHSGTKCFKPKRNEKNCVEVTIFAFIGLVLEVVHLKGEVMKTDISYMTDLSACPDCTMRLPTQREMLRARFPNVIFSEFKIAFILNYQEYNKLSKELKKRLRKKRTWISVRDSELEKRECDRGIDIGLDTFLRVSLMTSP